MIIDGIFYIKGRGWVLTGEPGEELKIGQKIHQLDGKCIGTIAGLEYSIGNFGRRPNIGVIVRRRLDNTPLPNKGDLVTFEKEKEDDN